MDQLIKERSPTKKKNNLIGVVFWDRLGAYMIDIIPIALLINFLLYFLLGYDDIINHKRPIRFIIFLIWILYSSIMDASNLAGTYGKHLMGIKVVDENGDLLTTEQSIKRNLTKVVSYIPLSLGFFWMLFHKERRTWHDLLTKSYVVMKDK